MDELNYYNKHYIDIDEKSRVIRGFSDAFREPKDEDILITEQGGRHFELFGEVNPPLMDTDGVYLYKWDGYGVTLRTEEERAADKKSLPPPPPTETERIRADVDYIAIMTGVDLDA